MFLFLLKRREVNVHLGWMSPVLDTAEGVLMGWGQPVGSTLSSVLGK